MIRGSVDVEGGDSTASNGVPHDDFENVYFGGSCIGAASGWATQVDVG